MTQTGHAATAEVSPWIARFAPLVPRRGASGGTVLDVACGGGRNARYFIARGHNVVALDRDLAPVADLAAVCGCTLIESDLEAGGAFPLAGRRFAGVVVTNYLFRPLLPALVAAVEPGGVLLYETFASGNERYGRPANPDFLLRPGELLEAVRGELSVVAYEEGFISEPRPAVIQHICARRFAEGFGPDPI